MSFDICDTSFCPAPHCDRLRRSCTFPHKGSNFLGGTNVFTMVLNLPKTSTQPLGRPRHCPFCDSTILQKWGRTSKPLKDLDCQRAEVHRYRCTDCSRTFRTYPPGIERSSRSKRLRTLAAFTWALGLSLDSVVSVFQGLGLELSRTTIWRDGRKMSAHHRYPDHDRMVTVLGVENKHSTSYKGAFDLEQKSTRTQEMRREKIPAFLEDEEITLILKVGQMDVSLGVVDIDGPRAAREWLQTLAQEFGMEINTPTNSSHPRFRNE